MSWKSKNGEVEDLKSYEIGFRDGLSNEWISVKDELPENKQIILAINEEKEMAVCKFEKTQWEYFFMLYHTSYQLRPITHWQLLPAPPSTIDEAE